MNFSDKLKLWPNKQSLCFLVLTRFDFTLMGWSETGPSFGPVGWFQVTGSSLLCVMIWDIKCKKDLGKNAEIREDQSISQSLLPFKVSPCSSFGLNSQNLFMFPVLSTSPVTLDQKRSAPDKKPSKRNASAVRTPDETKRWRCPEHKDAQTGQNSKWYVSFHPQTAKYDMHVSLFH